MWRVAVLDDYQGTAQQMADWGRLGPDVEARMFRDHLDDANALFARLEPFQAVVAMRERTPFAESLLARLPALRLLVTTGMANASIDLQAATRLGVILMATTLGMALGGWMSGALFDLTGSYHAAFANGLVWNFLNMAIAAWIILRRERRLALA